MVEGKRAGQRQGTKARSYAFVRVISGGRITIPEEIRDDMGIDVGDDVVLVKKESGWTLRAAPSHIPIG